MYWTLQNLEVGRWNTGDVISVVHICCLLSGRLYRLLPLWLRVGLPQHDGVGGRRQGALNDSSIKASSLFISIHRPKMRSFVVLAISLFAILASVNASTLLRRQTNIVTEHGTTIEPADGAVVAPGQSFPFSYQLMNYCFCTYVPVSVYLSTSPPTAADVTRQGLVDGSYIYTFGGFVDPNNGRCTLMDCATSLVLTSDACRTPTPPAQCPAATASVFHNAHFGRS